MKDTDAANILCKLVMKCGGASEVRVVVSLP